ncbi:hypothetical protein [Motilimonas eburnea]|uniref:hypothetical protein n=1 Tax=Motilimonas eburnea TaxID=1737488 RepID=UPI001E5FA254|nr:hypothetical protein [Motilimonas eburnea]MCE2573624.1 hypothetical protein [Motilimonas eburnea]
MRSITGSFLSLFAIPSGISVATQMLGKDIALAQHELKVQHHQQALFFAERAIEAGEHLSKIAALTIKAMIYMDINENDKLVLATTELALTSQLSFLEQKALLQELYAELNEIRLGKLAA